MRRELTACLRTGRVLRMPRARTRRRGKNFVSSEIMISQRPAEVADRAVAGAWGRRSHSGSWQLRYRNTCRAHDAVHHAAAPAANDRSRKKARVKNGPALAGHGAEAVCHAITRTITTLPDQLRRSLTWDQGAEMAQHARLKIDAGLQVYFCDPQSPWQRATNENTNGLLRQYFPKRTDLSGHGADEIPWRQPSIQGRARHSNGRRPQRHLTNFSDRPTSPLRRPLDSALAAASL